MGRKLFSVGVGEQLQDVDAPREVAEPRRWLEDQEGPGGPGGGGLGEANISYVVKPPSGMALPHRQLGCENSGETVSLSF